MEERGTTKKSFVNCENSNREKVRIVVYFIAELNSALPPRRYGITMSSVVGIQYCLYHHNWMSFHLSLDTTFFVASPLSSAENYIFFSVLFIFYVEHERLIHSTLLVLSCCWIFTRGRSTERYYNFSISPFQHRFFCMFTSRGGCKNGKVLSTFFLHK